jgi:hypothetical protein
MALGSPDGNLAPGTYSEIEGAGMVVTDKEGNSFYSKSMTIKINSISSSDVALEFSGNFTDDPSTNNTSFSITSGKLNAVIGGDSPCN